jgi:hypothetical protein
MSTGYGNPFLGPITAPGEPLILPVVYFDDFLTGVTEDGHKFSTTADKGDWLVSADAGGANPTVQDDADGGTIKFNCDGDAGDRMCVQLNGEPFYLQNKRRCRFKTRVKITNTTGDAFIGLSVNTTDPIASAPSDFIVFSLTADSDLEIQVDTGSAGTSPTDSGTDIEAATWMDLTFDYHGNGAVTFYKDGAKIGKLATNVPVDKYVSPVLCVESNGAEEFIEVDYVMVANDRSAA